MGTRMDWRALLLASASLMGVRPEMLGENQKALSSASPTDAHPPWTMTLRVQQCSTMIILIRMITQPTLLLQSTGTATITTCQTPHPSHHPLHPHPRPSNNNNNNSPPPHHTYPPTHQHPLPSKPHQNPHHHHSHQAHPNLTHPLQKSSYPTHRPTSPWQQPSHLRPASR